MSHPCADGYLEGALRHFRERAARQQEQRRARQERLRAAAADCARLLLRRFGASRVMLFGSVATGRADSRSDLDLAVEGLARARYFEALAALHDLADSSVDLVLWEEAPPTLRERILREGVALDGA